MRRVLFTLALLCIPALAASQEGRGVPAYQRGYLHPQFVADTHGNIGMLWVHPGNGGYDLYLARRLANGSLVNPVHVNSTDGDVLYLGHPEARPGLAAGPTGLVAVSWFSRAGQLMVAISRDGALSFEKAIAVDAGNARPEHAFSDVAFDMLGNLFVTWIDVRDAPAGHEEPAQLYAARIEDGKTPVVVNLTGDFTESICGCCRPDLEINGRDLTIGFRMVDDEGYRDIYRIRTGSDLTPTEPERMGPQMWKINACPMAGPAVSRDFIWFLDGSQGQMRLLEAASPTARPTPITVAKVQDPSAPQLIEGSEGPAWMLYLPGGTNGQVLRRESGNWRVVLDDIPPFCTDMVLVEGQLLMTGEKGEVLWMQARPVN